MRDAFLDLVQFEKACGNELSSHSPSPVNIGVVQLRHKLIAEESKETLDALDVVEDAMRSGEPVTNEMLADVADGIADLIYVAIGSAVRFGIDICEVWSRVHENNMSKFGEGSWVDETGKRRKPPGHKPPDILGAIKSQRPLNELYGEDV